MVKVTVLTFGSTGDVHPYIALAEALGGQGIGVRLATHGGYEEIARRRGLDFAAIGGEPTDILESELGSWWLRGGRNPFRFARGLAQVMEPLMQDVARQSGSACRDADAILVSLLGFYAGRQVAESLRIPLVLAPYVPIGATAAFPSPIMCVAPFLGASANRLTHLVGRHLMWQPVRRSINAVRRDVFGLPALSFRGLAAEIGANFWPVMYGYSSCVVPRPPDWDERSRVTGYWFLDRPPEWRPQPDVEAFVSDGPAPICIGFGSMHLPEVARVTDLVLRALRASRQRGILLGELASSGLDLPSTVCAIESCPHDWLFPRVAAAVHHGGAGTTAAALRAGISSIVVPFFADQPFWAWRVASLGAGPNPIPYRRLSAKRLADAIRETVTNRDMMRRAHVLGVRIREEDGLRRAVEGLQECATYPPRR
jgi:sterol 3beta-glucosyltransferase